VSRQLHALARTVANFLPTIATADEIETLVAGRAARAAVPDGRGDAASGGVRRRDPPAEPAHDAKKSA
jgi:hypothetical protein